MNPVVRAAPKSTTAMTRPRNQSAFQNADFMDPPEGRRGPFSRRSILPRRPRGVSPADIDFLAHALRPREGDQLGGDDEVLHRHPLRLEQGDLLAGGAAGAGAGDD